MVLTYFTFCTSLCCMDLAETAEVNEAAHELALQCLLPVAQLRSLIKYLYYDTLLSYSASQQAIHPSRSALAAASRKVGPSGSASLGTAPISVQSPKPNGVSKMDVVNTSPAEWLRALSSAARGS